MSVQRRAANARAAGDFGLYETLRRTTDADRYDIEDLTCAPDAASCKSRMAVCRVRAIRWSLAGGVLLSYVNHWPAGH